MRAATSGSAATAAVSIAAASKVCPRTGITVRSASKVAHIERASCSKPLKTESRIIMAATGMATATTLTPAIRLITEWDLGEKR